MWKIVSVLALVGLLSGAAAQGAVTAAPSNTAPPKISGGNHEGDTLTATSGSWSGSTPMSFHYRWRRCNSSGGNCRDIDGAKSQTYRLSGDDIGHRIRVSVTAQNSSGSANALSGATATIAKGLQPANTAAPVISGTPRDGQTLATTNGGWANSPTSFSYQWKHCDTRGANCSNVGGNHSTYKVDRGDIGSTIRVVVRARNRYGGTAAVSNPTGVVGEQPAAPGIVTPPTIAGTARDGQT